MLSTIFEKRIIIGYYLQPLLDMLKLNSVFQVRDLALCPEINSEGKIQSAPLLGKQFFDMDLDSHFRSTITEARLYFALYKNWEGEVEDVYVKQTLLGAVAGTDIDSDADLVLDADLFPPSQEEL